MGQHVARIGLFSPACTVVVGGAVGLDVDGDNNRPIHNPVLRVFDVFLNWFFLRFFTSGHRAVGRVIWVRPFCPWSMTGRRPFVVAHAKCCCCVARMLEVAWRFPPFGTVLRAGGQPQVEVAVLSGLLFCRVRYLLVSTQDFLSHSMGLFDRR